MLVLFVCTGNTCRSPMAEGIFRRLTEASGEPGPEILSAGIHAASGAPASEFAIRAAAEAGVDIGGHRSRPLTPELAERADVIVAMTATHRAAVLRLLPGAEGRVLLLRDLLPPGDPRSGADLPDPFGGSLEDYRATLREIADALGSGDPARRARGGGG